MRYLFIALSFALLLLGVACEKGAAGPLKQEPAKEEASKEKAPAEEAKADAGKAKADAGAAKTDAGTKPAAKSDEKEKAK